VQPHPVNNSVPEARITGFPAHVDFVRAPHGSNLEK